jgi:3-dehydrotetronate 4-kinase
MLTYELTIGPEIDPGIPVLFTKGEDRRIAMALKSENFGRPSFFSHALSQLGPAL